MRRILTALVCAGSFLGLALPASATFSIKPIVVTIDSADPTALVTVTNDGDDAVTLEVSGGAWSQSADGQVVVLPSSELVFYPKIISIGPKEKKSVRVAITAPRPVEHESSWRVFLTELPPPEIAAVPITEAQRKKMRIGIPIFYPPKRLQPSLQIRGSTVRANELSFDVLNGGNVHEMLQKITLVELDRTGHTIARQDVPAWYVLAKSERHFTVPIDSVTCRNIAQVAISVKGDFTKLAQTDAVSSVNCRS